MKCIACVAVLVATLGSTGHLLAQPRNLVGEWTGSRSERNPFNGQTFTIGFAFQFRGDGTFSQVARFGTLTILRVQGTYSIRSGQAPGNPSYTHVLSLNPNMVLTEPARDELRLLQIASLPNIVPTEQWTHFYSLAPAGGLMLKDRNGGESWGLSRIR